MPSLFYITDGITRVDFLAVGSGFCHKDYRPGYPSPKGGGVWIDPPLVDGRRLAIRSINNVIDTIELTVRGNSMDEISGHVSGLLDMLDKGMRYWTSPPVPETTGTTTDTVAAPKPVYFVIKGPYQTNARYAIVYDYRFSSDANPLAPPYGDNDPVVNLVTLNIERGLWLEGEPGEGVGLPLSITNVYSNINPVVTVAPLASNDDIAINRSAASGLLTATSGRVGRSGSSYVDFGIRFPNVTIPATAIVDGAYLTLVGEGGFNQICEEGFDMYGEAINNSPVFVNYADYIARARTENKMSSVQAISNTGAPSQIWGWSLTNIIREIIALPGWASGNALSLFLQSKMVCNPNQYVEFASWDHLTLAAPSLSIYTSSLIPITVGPTTEADKIMVANQDCRFQPNQIFVFDASGPTYTQRFGTALPWSLFPAAPAAGDILYIGIDNTIYSYPVFSNLIFNLSTPGNGLTMTWEYSAGAGVWNALTTNDNTAALTRSGQRSVHFEQPTTWATDAVNGITTYWIRIRLTAVAGGAVVPVQSTNTIWAARVPFVDISADDVSCDSSPQFEILVNPISAKSGITNNLTIDHVWIGRRKTSRSNDFRSHINLFHPGVTMNLPTNTFGIYASGNYTDPTAPLGGCTRYTVAGATPEAEVAYVEFVGEPARSDYVGTYRMFLRRRNVSNAQRMSYRALISNSNVSTTVTPLSYYTQTVQDTTSAEVCLLDFGTVTLPPSQNMITDNGVSDYFIHIMGTASGACDVRYFDLILIPIDEWAINVYQPIDAGVTAWTQGYTGTRIRIENLSTGGETIRAGFVDTSSNTIAALKHEKTGVNAFLPKEDQRFYFLFGTYYTGYLNYQRRYEPETVASITMKLLRAFRGL